MPKQYGKYLKIKKLITNEIIDFQKGNQGP